MTASAKDRHAGRAEQAVGNDRFNRDVLFFREQEQTTLYFYVVSSYKMLPYPEYQRFF